MDYLCDFFKIHFPNCFISYSSERIFENKIRVTFLSSTTFLIALANLISSVASSCQPIIVAFYYIDSISAVPRSCWQEGWSGQIRYLICYRLHCTSFKMWALRLRHWPKRKRSWIQSPRGTRFRVIISVKQHSYKLFNDFCDTGQRATLYEILLVLLGRGGGGGVTTLTKHRYWIFVQVMFKHRSYTLDDVLSTFSRPSCISTTTVKWM